VDGKPKLYERQWIDRHSDRWRVVARLRPGAGEEIAEADLNRIGQRLAGAFPTSPGREEFPGFATDVVPLRDQFTGRNLTLALWVLLGSVGMVLLIACVNVANLLLARGTVRERELAVRAALGAGRGRIFRQLSVESMLLASLACLLGLALAFSGIRTFGSSTPGLARFQDISIDTTVLVFTGLASVVAALLFGVAPAWKCARANHHDRLKASATSSSRGLRMRHVRGLLVIAECAMAVVLLAGAGLLVRSFVRLYSVDPGFDPRGVLHVRVDLAIPETPGWREREWAAFRDIDERVRTIPGVRHAGFIQNFRIASSPRTPVAFEVTTGDAEILNSDEGGVDRTGVNVEEVTPGFFQALAVPLREGRFFTYAEQNKPLAIVNDEFVRRFLRGQHPIGRRFSPGAAGSKMNWHTIVGVVGNMRRQGLEHEPVPEFFIPSTEPAMDLAVRVDGDPAAAASAVREHIRAVQPGAIVIRTTTMETYVGEWSAERRFQTLLLGVFATIALVLAAVGIYGVMQFAAAQRAKELGIRVALGARGFDLLRLMIGQGLRLPIAGLAIGLFVAYLLVGLLQSLLFEVNPVDPLTFGGVAVLLGATAIPACYLPAWRASRVDPIAVLRSE
jgi:predicted permease